MYQTLKVYVKCVTVIFWSSAMRSLCLWIAFITGILISIQVTYDDIGNFVFDFVPVIPTETLCYYSTIFISFSTCQLLPFLRKINVISTHHPSCKMDENDILVTVVPAKGGIVLMSRMMLEWSWHCNMCMGMVWR